MPAASPSAAACITIRRLRSPLPLHTPTVHPPTLPDCTPAPPLRQDPALLGLSDLRMAWLGMKAGDPGLESGALPAAAKKQSASSSNRAIGKLEASRMTPSSVRQSAVQCAEDRLGFGGSGAFGATAVTCQFVGLQGVHPFHLRATAPVPCTS